MVSKVRQKIVDAAATCFHEAGYNACGVQEIVDRAGVPKGSFYNYFKAKELLALEVLQNYTQSSGWEIFEDKSMPPIERLRAHFQTMADRYAGFGYSKGCLIGNLAAESTDGAPLIRKAIADSLTSWTKHVADTIRDGQSDDTVTADMDADQLARFLINSWEGAIVRMKIDDSREPLDDFFVVAFPLLSVRH